MVKCDFIQHPPFFSFNLTLHTKPVILSLQQPSGVFAGDSFGETDTRFLYCAVNALSLLGRLNEMNKDKAVEYIERCRNYDGGFGSSVGAESHAAQGTAVHVSTSFMTRRRLIAIHSICVRCGSCHPGPIRRGGCQHSSLVVIRTAATERGIKWTARET